MASSGETSRGSVSGVELAQGVGVQEARGFWADAWSHVVRRWGARFALCWLSLVAFLGLFAPLLANGHPLIWRELDQAGSTTSVSSPLFRNLSSTDVALVLGALVAVPWVLLGRRKGAMPRVSVRLATVLFGVALGAISLIAVGLVAGWFTGGHAPGWVRDVRGAWWLAYAASAVAAAGVCGVVMLVLPMVSVRTRLGVAAVVVAIATMAGGIGWQRPLQVFRYVDAEAAGTGRGAYVAVPFSPEQRYSELNRLPPGSTLGEGLTLRPGSAPYGRTFALGTDAFGQNVLTHLIYACRLSISIGLVSTGISVLIGVTLGALAGYFGGWVDVLVQRVIEVFMAVPVLFLLIVAAGVLPPELRNTYVTMAIIGLFSWTGAARFTRAEFYKLRGQDFVQSARAVGLPLRSILFKHMLPNGVTPVLVDASFAVAAAILAEATLSFLGLGPVDSASWGKLLSSSMNAEGEFKWWLAVFPGCAIFLTVLSYNLLGEALRDAIDPKLKKARV